MATRGCIARKTNSGFAGVYHHWDSYPSQLGKTLYSLYNGYFNKNIDDMLSFLIDAHPAGWSSINGCDFNFPAGFGGDGPQCYCHGERAEEENILDEKSYCGIEYVYVFNKENMEIIANERVIKINLNEPEPNWEEF
jgi:hypothetical protein